VPTLATYVFKPRYPKEMIGLVLESFTQHWLNWCDSGVHLHWRNDAPEGYIKIDIDIDGHMDQYTETCWREDPVQSHDLTESMFVLLDQTGFFDVSWVDDSQLFEDLSDDERVSGLDTDKPKFYSFFERELDEVMRHMCEDGSRMVCFWSDKIFMCDVETPVFFKGRITSLTEYTLQMDLPPANP
jgi:hypothetical protein